MHIHMESFAVPQSEKNIVTMILLGVMVRLFSTIHLVVRKINFKDVLIHHARTSIFSNKPRPRHLKFAKTLTKLANLKSSGATGP